MSGFAALCAYFLSIPDMLWWRYIALAFALAIMLVLTKEFIRHFIADTKALRSHPKAE